METKTWCRTKMSAIIPEARQFACDSQIIIVPHKATHGEHRTTDAGELPRNGILQKWSSAMAAWHLDKWSFTGLWLIGPGVSITNKINLGKQTTKPKQQLNLSRFLTQASAAMMLKNNLPRRYRFPTKIRKLTNFRTRAGSRGLSDEQESSTRTRSGVHWGGQ